MSRRTRLSRRLGALGFCLVLSGCAGQEWTDFPVTPEAQAQLVHDGLEIVRLDAASVARFGPGARAVPSDPPPPLADTTYRVGVGDVIAFTVWDHPDLTTESGGGDAPDAGNAVRPDGTIFFPYVGHVPARGRTLAEITSELSTRLAEYIPDPQIELRVARYVSQKVQVLGEVEDPGAVTLTNEPITILEAVDRRGGFTEHAATDRLKLDRAGRSHALDFLGFEDRGTARQNPLLRAGDVIRVPRREPLKAYLLGQVANPGIVELSQEAVSLTEALSGQGGLAELRANARGVFVFRAEGARVVVAQLDVRSPLAFLIGTRFALRPDDVVYVTTAPIARWNQVITSLLPTVSAAGAVRDLP